MCYVSIAPTYSVELEVPTIRLHALHVGVETRQRDMQNYLNWFVLHKDVAVDEYSGRSSSFLLSKLGVT